MSLVTRCRHLAAIPVLLVFTAYPSQDESNLELRLQADPVKPAAPRTFSLLLLNTTDHNVYLPVPVMDCEDGYKGWLQLFSDFTPFGHGPVTSASRSGCALDRGGPWPSLLDRLTGSVEIGEDPWRTLRPGEAMALKPNYTNPSSQYQMICHIVPPGGSPPPGIIAFKNGDELGTYKFWVKYTPPVILGLDQKILEENKIDIPRKELRSNRLILVKSK